MAQSAPGSTEAHAAAPLVLTAPTSNTAYQIHPGLPRTNQAIEIAGYAADGAAWSTLRLMHDDEPLVTSAGTTRIAHWWPLEPGEHRFWLEGESAQGETVQSAAALVIVEEYANNSD